MKKLLSLPPNLVDCFHNITDYNREEWFCAHDPIGKKVGSGGGTAWLLQQANSMDENAPFLSWLSTEKRILIHAGGQSRRLPAYAPSGKILTPIPVFRWERGQRLSQDLLSLQVPLYEKIMEKAPDHLHTMVVSGDVYIRATQPLQPIPDADVVCYGLWTQAETASHHGVFVVPREHPNELKCMVQKPSVETFNALLQDNLCLTDIGIWMLSDRAVELLMNRSANGQQYYDLYTDFGRCLGTEPTLSDNELAQLSVAILPLPGGEFYHFGSSSEIISSMLAIQNRVSDQREILHIGHKPHPSIFQQNAEKWTPFTTENRNVWVENSCISDHWTISQNHIITGVPDNRWTIELKDGQCVDIVPIGEKSWAVRPYGFNDTFKGDVDDATTLFIGKPITEWFNERQITQHPSPITPHPTPDIQSYPLFPVVNDIGDVGLVLRWMLNEPSLQGGRMLWEQSEKLSADEISAKANLRRLFAQRTENRYRNWPVLANNYKHSVFYQIDLQDAAHEFAMANLPAPHPLPDSEPLLIRMQDAMLRDEIATQQAKSSTTYSDQAFSLLRQSLTQDAIVQKQTPRMSVHVDQIVWSRSPVRIDIAGGWTDTPPYCLMEGGRVVNIAIELNGQQPLQAYVKPCREHHLVLRSIDLGATEIVETYDQLRDYNHVGSPFSIPKAALALAGFLPEFCTESYSSLEKQLHAFGAGIELTMLSAIPAGSGLGTSSILAATVLAALSDFCALNWDKAEVGHRTLILEQMLTSGGGWQDQYGGILPGVKILETPQGFMQQPLVRFLPTQLYTQPDNSACHLLYYTGITRTAKQILAQIVRRMFLNQHDELMLLREMRQHTLQMYEVIQRNNFHEMGTLLRKTWEQKQRLDSGSCSPEIQQLTALINEYCLGYELPGAGGGGFLYMIAKDPDAAARIRHTLEQYPLNNSARFVTMALSEQGLQVSRS